MKNLFYFLLGLSLIVLTSATTASILTIKPETPKSVFVKEYRMERDVVAAVKQYSKAGYIVKSCNGAGSGGWWILIMEKY
jgi:hypothetical protein